MTNVKQSQTYVVTDKKLTVKEEVYLEQVRITIPTINEKKDYNNEKYIQ